MLWGDKRTVPAALQLLSVPAGGPQQMNFKDPDFQRALKVSIVEGTAQMADARHLSLMLYLVASVL